jgi:DNA-binding NtrC family response regulator
MSNLLIIDDEFEVRETLKLSLEGEVSAIFEAGDGIEAQAIIQSKTQIDAIVCDINMPRMNGIEFLTWLRSLGNALPVVILTAHGDKNLAGKALKLGAMDFLDKPWNVDQLIETVKQAVEVGQELNRWGLGGSAEDDIKALQIDSSAAAFKRMQESTGAGRLTLKKS